MSVGRGVRLGLAIVLAVLATLPVAGPATSAAPRGAALRAEATPRSNRVYFITDSVGLGTREALPAAFGSDWDVSFDGFPALMVEQMESNHVRKAPLDSWGDSAVVAGGYNYPYWDPERFDRSIDSIIAAFEERGVTKIFWVTLREVKPQFVSAAGWRSIQPYYWYFPTVNEHLRRAVLRHDNLTLIDWAAIADRTGLTYDAIHLTSFGAAEYSNNVARVVKGAVNRIPDGSVTEVEVAGVRGVPADASAVALNLAVTDSRRGGFLTAFPCGEPVPLAANLNFVADDTVSAAAVVPVGADGKVCIYNSAATHIVVDVMGSFPAGGAYTRAGPTRLADTRGAGEPVAGGSELRVRLPAEAAAASAAVLNITAIGGDQAGFVTTYRCGDPVPSTSNVNFEARSITPNLAVVAPDAAGEICLRPNRDAHLVVDLFGAFAGESLSLAGATRSVDTRTGAEPAAGGVVAAPTGAAGAAGVLVNVTAVGARSAGFLTTFPCGTSRPPTANLNVGAGATRGNFAVATPDAAGNVCVFTNVASHVVVDVMGSLTTDFVGLTTPTRALDSRVP